MRVSEELGFMKFNPYFKNGGSETYLKRMVAKDFQGCCEKKLRKKLIPKVAATLDRQHQLAVSRGMPETIEFAIFPPIGKRTPSAE